MTASVIAHLSLLALLFVFSDVHPFGAAAPESIPVDIVAPQDIPQTQDMPQQAEVEKTPEPVATPAPQPDFTALDKPAPAAAPAPASQQPPPQKQAALPAPSPVPSPAPNPAPQPATPPQGVTQTPAYKPPEPDLSVKYNVMLGLPPPMEPSAPSAADKGKDNFDAPATMSADISSSVVAAFRRHLRTCSKLPPGLRGSDDVKVKLRIFMGQDGKLAAEPQLIEASASAKGPLLMRGAISALEACQPYAMLPADRYGEWRVLDLNFTVQDFAGS